MADQDETIKVVIEVVDKFSKPLGDLQKNLREMNRRGAAGGKGSGSWADSLESLRDLALQAAAGISTRLVPAIRLLGLTGGAAAASLGPLYLLLRHIGESADQMRRFGQSTGFAIQTLEAYEAAGKRVGVSQQQMRQSLRQFSDEMDKMKKNLPGGSAQFLREHGLGELVPQFRNLKDVNAQLDFAVKTLDRIRNPRERRMFLEGLGLPSEWSELGRGELRKAVDEYRKQRGAGGGAEGEAAKKAEDAANRVTSALDAMQKKFREGLTVPGLKAVADQFNSVAENIENITRKYESLGQVWEALKKKGLDLFNWSMQPVPGTEGSKSPGRPMTWREQLFGLKLGPMLGIGGGAPGDDSKQQDMLQEGTKKGVLDGLREFFGVTGAGASPTSYGGGGSFGGAPIVRASLGGGGGFGGGGRGGRGGGGGGGGGPMGTLSGLDDNVGAGLGGSDFLKARRARFAKEFEANPELKKQVAATLSLEHESDAVAVAESLMNRADYTGTSIRQRLFGGKGGSFYGPIRRGMLPGRMRELERNPARLAKLMGAIDTALGGSHVIGGATDQGSRGDPNFAWQGGRIMRYGEVYNDWAGGPGGHAGAARYREMVERALRGEGPGAPIAGVPMPRPRPRIDERPDVPREQLLNASMRSNQFARVEGDARVRIELANFPRGTKSSATAGGIFSEVELHRGNTMPLASESA